MIGYLYGEIASHETDRKEQNGKLGEECGRTSETSGGFGVFLSVDVEILGGLVRWVELARVRTCSRY